MKDGEDFLSLLPHELSMKILTSYKDPSDLVRISSVSHSWRRFVIKNGLCKLLSLRMFPQLSRVDHVNELCCPAKGHAGVGVGSSNFMEWETLEREHRVYAFLAHQCLLCTVSDCISEAIIASSTDNYPDESIDNTLEPRDRRVAQMPSYWSSKGQSNPAVPETLTYKLVSDLCVVNEIRIRPFQVHFHFGGPIYSAKSVRFRLGQIKSYPHNHEGESSQYSFNDKFSWAYTSQEFEMAQEYRLQSFKLPEPILCIGGILQIELLNRAQICDSDGLFYFCVSYVQVVGRPLSPFGIRFLEPSENFVLEVQSYSLPALPKQTSSISSLQMRVGDLEQDMNLMGGSESDAAEYGFEWEESDEDY